MGFPVRLPLVQYTTSASSSITVTLDTHASGDVIFLILTQDGGGTAIAPDATAATAGWTMIGTQAASGGVRQAVAYLICDSAAEANPTFTGANDEWIVHQYVVDDCDTAALLDATHSWQRTDWNNAYSTATSTVSGSSNAGAAITPPVGSLLLIGACSDGAGNFIRFKTDEVFGRATTFNHASDSTSATITAISGIRQVDGSATCPTLTLYSGLNTEGGNIWIIAIKNASGGRRAKDCRTGIDEIAWHGSFASTLGHATFVDGIDDITTTPLASINTITCSSTNPTVSQSKNQALTPWGKMTALSNADTTASWGGSARILSAAKNMQNKIFAVQWEIDAGNATANRFASEGVIAVFSDNTNWIAYQLRPQSIVAANTPYCSVIALGKATSYASSGTTIDWTAITRVGYAFHRSGTGTTALSVKNEVLMPGTAGTAQGTGYPSLTGGSNGRGADFSVLPDALGGFGHYMLAEKLASKLVSPKCSVRVGNGSTTTYFDSSGSAVEFPVARNLATQPDFNSNANTMGVEVYAGASDTINLTAFSLIASQAQNLSFNASSSLSATYDFSGMSVVGPSPSLLSGITVSGATISGCDTLYTLGATLLSVNVLNTLAGASAAAVSVDTSGTTLTSSEIDLTGTSAGYHLELGTAVTAITLANVTFTGTPGTDKVHVLKTSGTVTITISGTTTLAAGDVTSAGATVVIAAPEIYQVVSITNLVVGSRVQIYDTTNSLELANEIAAGTTVTWTDSVAYVADRDIRVRIAYVSGTSAKQFIESAIGTVGDGTPNSEVMTYRANQVNDTVYNANAENGATIYGGGEITFVDSSPDRVEMAISTNTLSLPKMYAAWVYYAFTSAGIAVDIDYINAIDTANYEYTNIKWKNTSSPSVKLKITGGYAWDSSTLDPMDLVDDTGGTLFLAPAHVVPYQTTGTYAITGNISTVLAAIPSATDNATAVLSAAASTPIAADVKKMNAATVTGTGQEGDLWRGA